MESLFIYGFTFVLSIIAATFYQKTEFSSQNFLIHRKINWKKFFWIFLIILPPVLISTLRRAVGTDFWGYLTQFHFIRKAGFSTFLKGVNEPLFFLLNRFADIFFFGNVISIYFLCALIINSLVVLTLDYSKKIPMNIGLLVYYLMFFGYTLNVMRQMIAVMIVLFSIRFVLERKFWKYAIGVGVATMFHYTAFMTLVFYFLYFNKDQHYQIKKKIYIVLIALSPLWIMALIKVGSILPIVNRYFAIYQVAFKGYGFGFIINIFPLLFYALFYYRDLIQDSVANDFYLNLALMSIPVRLVAYHQIWAYRLVLYLTGVEIILIPTIFSIIMKKRSARLDFVFLLILCIGYFWYFFYIQNTGEIFPYRSRLAF